jgi:hypothetical protein
VLPQAALAKVAAKREFHWKLALAKSAWASDRARMLRNMLSHISEGVRRTSGALNSDFRPTFSRRRGLCVGGAASSCRKEEWSKPFWTDEGEPEQEAHGDEDESQPVDEPAPAHKRRRKDANAAASLEVLEEVGEWKCGYTSSMEADLWETLALQFRRRGTINGGFHHERGIHMRSCRSTPMCSNSELGAGVATRLPGAIQRMANHCLNSRRLCSQDLACKRTGEMASCGLYQGWQLHRSKLKRRSRC